jgi:hypothetical protein
MIFLVDLTARTHHYNQLLINSLENTEVVYVNYKSKYFINLSFILNRSSISKIKKVVTGMEYLINFIILILICRVNKPSIIHFQWLPASESIPFTQRILLKLIKRRDIKVGLTLHNVIPHNVSEKIYTEKNLANNNILYSLLDFIIVHNVSSEVRFKRLHNVNLHKKVQVIPHGLLYPSIKNEVIRLNYAGPIKLLCLGNFSSYKGYIEFIENFNKLDVSIKRYFLIQAYGKFSDLSQYEKIKKYKFVDVKNSHLSNEEFIKCIDSCDYGLLPYKDISDSGILFSYLARNKPLLFSNIPRFHEFFNEQIADCIIQYPLGEFLLKLRKSNYKEHVKYFKRLSEKYEWSNISIQYKILYNKLK